MQVHDRPLLTDVYEDPANFCPDPDSAYVFATSAEVRSNHVQSWQASATRVSLVRITEETSSSFQVEGSDRRFFLRGAEQLRSFWGRIQAKTIYLDITGMAHHVWAPLVRVGLTMRLRLMAVYVEPVEYKHSAAPTEGEIFDLSERTLGIDPIPGFTSLADGPEEAVCFVPLLGFEGIRLAYILENVQPPGGRIIPVVGLPGFRPEYPFHAYQGNKPILKETGAWKNVEFAAANCPFSLFYLLKDIAARHDPHDIIKIAPIGTKPHALGAVLYALANPGRVELIYDHPIRKAGRTKGAARLLVYHLSAFVAV